MCFDFYDNFIFSLISIIEKIALEHGTEENEKGLERNQVDKFDVTAGNVGNINKIRCSFAF